MKHSPHRARNSFFFVIEMIGIAISDRIIFVSEDLKSTYSNRYKIPEEKAFVLSNNIADISLLEDKEKNRIRKSLGIAPDNFVISTAGVLNEGKNISFILKAISKLGDDRLRVLIIGDEVVSTGERQRLETLTRQLAIEERVIFCGWRKDPVSLIASSDLFVFPSRHEGSPNALLEALGCRIPCLGSDIPEISEILKYDDLLFPLDNHSNLAEKIRAIAADASAYNHVRNLSAKRSRKYMFDWHARVLKLIS